MNNKLIFLALLGITHSGQQAEAQEHTPPQNPYSGDFQLGIRGTMNPFFKNGAAWLSYGAQLRVKISRRFNTEWFGEYYPAITRWKAERSDIRIGSAAMYYPLHEIYTGKECTPYFSIGPTSTYTRITVNRNTPVQQEVSRWGFGIIAGMGMLLNVTPRLNFGFVTQYIAEIGSQFRIRNTGSTAESKAFPVQLPDTRVNYEGQLLFCMNVNYTIGDLW